MIQICYVGPKEHGLEYLQALSSWTGERCLLNEVHEKTFLSQQDSVAQVLRGRRGNQWYIRSALITSLPDEAINQTVLDFADTPVGCSKPPPLYLHRSTHGSDVRVAVCQRGSLNSQVEPLPILKGLAFPSPGEKPHSRSRLYTSGKWALMTHAACPVPKM